MTAQRYTSRITPHVLATRPSPTDAFTVPRNAVWNPQDAEYYVIEDRAADDTPTKIRGIVMDKEGRIYGYRNMTSIRVNSEDRNLIGVVSVGHRKYQAVTHSEAFNVESEPGTIVRVELLLLKKLPDGGRAGVVPLPE